MGIEFSNIVNQKNLRQVQKDTLNDIASALALTAGPFGSNAIILHKNQFNEYSKDGYKVLSNLRYYDPLEVSIQGELVELTRHIVKEVGDGTTSTVLLSSKIFNALCDYKDANSDIPNFKIIDAFKNAVKLIKDKISTHKNDVTIDDIYKICMISTNGNKDISDSITNVYKEFGLGVFIDVGVSNTTETLVKSYDGLTLEKGYPSAAYINTTKGTCSIRNPRIYQFRDPIDTPEMVSFLEKIIYDNIIQHMQDMEFVPTVILAPSISRDVSSSLEELETMLYSYDQNNTTTMKPPILIITGINNNRIDQFNDITRLCGCKAIVKYIDPELQKKAIEEGQAPTIDNITDNWYGTAELVDCDNIKTKFINPEKMFDTDEEGNRVHSVIYKSILNFVESELEVAIKNNEGPNVTGDLKRRINSLKANMVDLLIGGVTTTDRDSVRDLVEDAVLNCRSACKHGYGYGANFEGFRASHEVLNTLDIIDGNDKDGILEDMLHLIHTSYKDLITDLYSTVMSRDKALEKVKDSLHNEKPLNLRSLSFDDEDAVLCTIDSDIVILDSISKIITIMFTANQALLISPMDNKYKD